MANDYLVTKLFFRNFFYVYRVYKQKSKSKIDNDVFRNKLHDLLFPIQLLSKLGSPTSKSNILLLTVSFKFDINFQKYQLTLVIAGVQ